MNANAQQNAVEYLKTKKSVAVFMHIEPDWDALGSASALQCVLRENGVLCDVYTDAPLSFAMSLIRTDTRVYNDDENSPFDYECLCVLDAGDIKRLGRAAKRFAEHADTVCIDHHVQNGSFAKLMCVDPAAAATGQILYELCGGKVSKQAAAYLFAAISSDTGSFKYSNATSRTFEIAAELTKTGIDMSQICEALYESKTEVQLRLTAETIERTHLYCDGKVAVCAIPNEVLIKYGATKSDTEALSALPRTICSVLASAFITQQGEGYVKASFRSKGSVDVQRVAAALGGGGHIHASGATFIATLKEAESRLAELLSQAIET
ncbi:MAG: bifunctional oligoribonuclease/PAP phosphatase NrnA [Clostridia bacterium]|nr:bifunctional oligoribonuclease/PAP phosphatase NrnA [Clostridia bacterium]